MKKPVLERKYIRKNSRVLFDVYSTYTPQNLREIADYMEENGITDVEFEIAGNDGYFECYHEVLETEAEASKRYKKEIKAWEKYNRDKKLKREKEKQKIIKSAKKFGLKIIEEK